MTPAERRLWQRLRDRQLHGFKFRRQHMIDSYIVDFCCEEGRLAIEVDGGQHALNVGADERRTEDIRAHGYRVLRVWNNDVMENTEGVLQAVLMALGEEDA